MQPAVCHGAPQKRSAADGTQRAECRCPRSVLICYAVLMVHLAKLGTRKRSILEDAQTLWEIKNVGLIWLEIS